MEWSGESPIGGGRTAPGRDQCLCAQLSKASLHSRDSGAEVSEDEVEDVGVCEGTRLVDLIMMTLRKTCSLLLLSANTDIKNGTEI